MAYEVTLTGTTSSTEIVYGVNTYSVGKYLRQFDAGDKLVDLQKFRVPGTNGNLVMRNGTVGHVISMCVRYIANSIVTLEAQIATDLNYFSSEAFNISYQEQPYVGCNLIPGSAKKVSPIQMTGRNDTDVFCDVGLKFTEDLPV